MTKARNGEAGVALVEFALSIVLALTIIFGIIDFGRAIFAYVWVANTARIRGPLCYGRWILLSLSRRDIM